MTPQVHLETNNHLTPAPLPPTLPVLTPPLVTKTSPQKAPALQDVTLVQRQGLAMAWVGIMLGTLLLLGGLALWAAVALSAGFNSWLLAIGVMGALMAVVVVTVIYGLLRSGR